MRLEGKVALISGGGRGIGAACVKRFLREGARVVAGDIREEPLDEEVAAFRDAGQAIFVTLDVTKEQDWAAALRAALVAYGALHVLVNCAGIAAGGKLEHVGLDAWNEVMAVNSTGSFLGCRTVIGALRDAGGGSIINISSQLGLVGADTSSPQYQASKGAVRLLTKSAAVQYAAENIRVNSVHPGPVLTPMVQARFADPEWLATTLGRVPLGRLGRADEVANCVLFLASDESSFMTGSELVVDGGWTAQ